MRRVRLIFWALFFCLGVVPALAQVDRAWVRRHNGPRNGWAAANKDKTPVKKESKAQTAWSVPKKIQVTKAQLRPGWITLEEHDRTREKLMRSEIETKSVYQAVTGVMEDVPFFQSGVLGIEPAPENFDVAGTSYYDINAIDRNPRQIAIPKTNRNVAIAWAKSSSADLVPRNWFASLWIGASDSIQYVISEQQVTTGGTGRGGFGGVTYLPRTGRMVIYSHHDETPRGTFLAIEDAPGTFGLSDEINVPDSLPGNPTENMGIWPTAAGGFLIDTPADLDGDGDTSDDTVETVHVFCTEGNTAGGAVKNYIYARGIMRFNDSLKFMGFNGNRGVSVDTGTEICPVVVTSKRSPKVALIYTAERWCDYEPTTCSDVYYIESTSGGNDWFTGGTSWSFPAGTNITQFDSSNATRATGDVMGVYDDSNELVISWNQWVDWDIASGGGSRETDLYVWAADFGVRKAQDGNFTKLKTGLQAGGTGYTLQWPHIAVHDGTTTSSRKGFLYMTYARYGNNDTAFADTSYDGIINGEVYITASTNGGKSWSAGINVTNSQTPGCPAPVSGNGTCLGVSFASCAERADDTIYIAYMTDENSGDVIGDNPLAQRTNNEVYFMKYPAFTPVATKQITVTPANFIQDPDSAVNLTDIFLVQNIGNADLKVDSIREGNPATWLKFNDTDTAGFTILETGADVVITFIVNDSGLADGAYHDTLLVYNNSANNPIVEVPVILVVDNINDAPILDSIGPKFVIQQDTLIFVVTASDPNGTVPILTAQSLPANATFFDSTNGKGTFTFNPDITQQGIDTVIFKASDGNLSDSEFVPILVINLCTAKPGDANADAKWTLADAIAIANYIFQRPGCSPLPLCWLNSLLCQGDWNGSGTVTLADAIRGVNYIFNKPGGPWNAVPVGVCCLP